MSGLNELIAKPPVLMDGAVGTMLQDLGLPSGAPPEVWNLERPNEVRDLAASYAGAGSAIVQTNTFGANRARLEKYRLEDNLVEINVRAAKLAREGAGSGVFLAGSVGPSGLCTGINPPAFEMLSAVFAEQCQALVDGGADLLNLETFYDIMEFEAALKAAADSKVPFMASMTFQETPRGFFTMMGVKPSEALRAAREAGAAVVGANCTLGSKAMGRLILEMAQGEGAPLLMKPNAGQPALEGDRTVYRQTASEFAADMAQAVRSGATVVGGCCGTTPEFIRELASLLGGQG
jgi:5-methyltetrahydrofolate--homocysteine methyltransferase